MTDEATQRIQTTAGMYSLVTSYTPESIIIYMPDSAVLCSATSATEKDFDMSFLRLRTSKLKADAAVRKAYTNGKQEA